MISEDKKNILIKVLNLTQSNQDGEALSAARTANKILFESDLTWAGVLSRLMCPHCNGENSIEVMIQTIKDKSFPGSWAGDFIIGLEQSYKKNRRLTPRQTDTLKRIYESNK